MGVTLLSAGLFTNEIAPTKIAPKVTVFLGITAILIDVFGNLTQKTANFGTTSDANDGGAFLAAIS
jgi:hypothetical protein